MSCRCRRHCWPPPPGRLERAGAAWAQGRECAAALRRERQADAGTAPGRLPLTPAHQRWMSWMCGGAPAGCRCWTGGACGLGPAAWPQIPGSTPAQRSPPLHREGKDGRAKGSVRWKSSDSLPGSPPRSCCTGSMLLRVTVSQCSRHSTTTPPCGSHLTAGGSGGGCAGMPCSPPAPAAYPCAGGTGTGPGGPAAGCGTASGTG